jgi:peptidoglycan/LPS O-acetylase OafA/YrhL
MLHPNLYGETGVAIILVGGALACHAYSKDGGILQATAGFLLITGFACLGVAVHLVGGSPF